MKLLILVDVANLFFTVKNKFNSKVDYDKLIHLFDGEVYRAIAYGSECNGDATEFKTYLQHRGFELRFKEVKIYGNGRRKANSDVDMAVDAMRILPMVDTVVLGTADGDFGPLVEYIQHQGKRCYVVGCSISNTLRSIADKAVEIDISLLETP